MNETIESIDQDAYQEVKDINCLHPHEIIRLGHFLIAAYTANVRDIEISKLRPDIQLALKQARLSFPQYSPEWRSQHGYPEVV